jgi:putative ABC transport system permease protein
MVISVAGVAFAVILIFMQLGFLGSVTKTASMLFDRLDFDLFFTSSEYIDLSRPSHFPRERLARARKITEVTAARPVSLGTGMWRAPASAHGEEGPRWNILVLGLPPDQVAHTFRDPLMVFREPTELEACQINLTRPNVVLIDRLSRPEYGSAENLRPGVVAEINDREVVLAGNFAIGTGFSYNALLICSEESLALIDHRPDNDVAFGLIKVTPGADLHQVQARIKDAVPDVSVYTREEITSRETDYWLKSTAIGLFFSAGVIVALIVGTIFVYQMMAADIRNHISEYATVKAIGYRGSFLATVVLWQAVFLALVGFVPGLVASLAFYGLTRSSAHIPIGMTAARVGGVLLLTLGMCLVSGLLAMRKVHSADPADLF